MADLWGVLLGGVLSLVGGFGAKAWDEWRQRKALRAAFRAEIDGFLKIAALRKHLDILQSWVEAWERGEDQPAKMSGVPADDPLVYSKNVDKIGALGSKGAAEVVEFYFLLAALRVNFRMIQAGDVNKLPIDQRPKTVESAIHILKRMTALGEELVARL